MVLTRNEWFCNMRRNMGIYSRPLRNLQQPSALAPGCFGMRRTRACSWTTYTKTARTTVRSWAVAGLPGPPRAAPRCRKRSAAESRPPGLETCRNMPIFTPIKWIWKRSIPQICAPIFRGSSLKKRESITLYGQPS